MVFCLPPFHLNCVHLCRTDDDNLQAEISNGSPVPPFCSECVEERFVLKLLQVQRGAQFEWNRGIGKQESLSGNHVPQPCPFLAAEFHGTSGMHVQSILIISCHITVIIKRVNQTDCTWRWTGRPLFFVCLMILCVLLWARWWTPVFCRAVFLQGQALASIILGSERFSWNLIF